MRIDANTTDGNNIYPLAFQNVTGNTTTIVLINDNGSAKAVKLTGNNLPVQFSKITTSAIDDAQDYGLANSADIILLPANSVVTLFK